MDYRSKSYAGGRTNMQIEPYRGGGGAADLRSYSYSGARGGGGGAAGSYQYQYEYGGGGGGSKVGYWGSVAEERPAEAAEAKRSKSKRRWLALADPDMERKRRVASYKAYSVEGKVKGSFRKSFKWIKDRYLHLVYGWS
ncbi:secretory carrier-associated membrane protein 5 [Oryza brachyantha]|uniref:DUF3511 domain-containing protein n=1 Tax=Oryza brachyantha TaxID=4533 RepID=J3L162_ORYBR|nr:secretory carrier-associated membrane protein 5 [Oryza brachyantha]